MTDVVNPKSASPDQLLPYHKKISAEGKALMKCFISYTYMVLKSTPKKVLFISQKAVLPVLLLLQTVSSFPLVVAGTAHSCAYNHAQIYIL